MKRLFFILVSTLFGVLAGEEFGGQPVEVLKNDYLEAFVVPGTMGCIARLRWLPGKAELFQPYRYEKIVVNELLPTQEKVTPWGNRTLIYNSTVLFYQKLALIGRTAGSLTMSGRFIGGLPVEMTRKLTLKKDSALFTIEITLVNTSNKKQEVRLWEHLVPNPDGETPDVSFLCGAGARRIGRYQTTEKNEPGLILDTFAERSQNRYLVPGGDWIAATAAKSRLTLFLRAPAESLEPDGCFYSQKHAVSKIHTAEILLSPWELKPGEKRSVTLELGVLCGLKTVRRMHGGIGWDFYRKGSELHYRAAAFETLPAHTMTVTAGTWSKEFPLPALRPGMCIEGKIADAPDLPDNAFDFKKKND